MWLKDKTLNIALIAWFSFTPILFASTVQAICSGNRCNQGDPKSNGCDNDAYNFSETTNSYSEWGISHTIYVELRYSPKCQAVWTRAGRFKGKDSSIWVETKDGTKHNIYSPSKNGTYYTDMLEKASGTKACASVQNQTWCTGGMP